MIFFNIALSIFLTISDLYCWKKYEDNKFFFISIIGGLVVLFNILSFTYDESIFLSGILTTLLLGLVSWYDWKKFTSRIYLWLSLLSGVLAVIKGYDLYFKENLEEFSAGYRFISSAIVGLLLTGIIIITIIIVNHKPKET